jgi:hypothetical protein
MSCRRRVSLAVTVSTFKAVLFGCAALGANATLAAECPTTSYGDRLDATQPLNLGQLKLQLLDYKCFGAYDRDVRKALAEAQTYVERRAPEVVKPALVLDIDETSLSNWPEILANDFGYIPSGSCDLLPKGPCGAEAWELSGRAEAIGPTLSLFNAARANGVTVFFITGRKEGLQQRAAVEANLRAAKYEDWAALFMRPAGTYSSVKDYKTAKRAEIAAQGFTIIANVGDQKSDLDGGYAEQVFRVPNPFYFIP